MSRRLLVAVLAVAAAAVAACGGGSGSNTGSSSSTPTPTAQAVTVNESEFKIDGLAGPLKAGDYTMTVKNIGSFPHDLHFLTPDGSEVAKTDVIQANGSATLQVTLKAGTYTYQCNVDGHAARGMKGTVTVN